MAIPPDLTDVLLLAAVNPATVAAGYYLGRRANEKQKLVLAPFVAGIAGALFALILMKTGLYEQKIRLLAGIFVASAVLGTGWAWLGFTAKRWSEGK